MVLADTVGPSGAGTSFNSTFLIPVISTDTTVSLHIYNAAFHTAPTVRVSLMSI
jgi:hypothetical protein